MLENQIIYTNRGHDTSTAGESTVSALTLDLESIHESSRYDAIHPERPLWGRSRPMEMLQAALERMVQDGRRELVVISGKQGMGKSALAETVRQYNSDVYFGKGKFDQWSNPPYSAIAKAISELIDQIISRDEVLDTYRAAVRAEMGDAVYILTPLMPNLEQLAGLCGIPSTLSNASMEHAITRVNHAFSSLLRAISSPQRPVALILDDVHYGDTATLDVLKTIMTDRELGYILLILTVRNEDVWMTQPLTQINLPGTRVTEIQLEPLTSNNIYLFIASLLQEDSSSILSLTEIVYYKSNGNPFFAQQFIKLLQVKELLIRSPENRWTWDSARVADEAILSGNCMEVTLQIINQLHPMVQHLLEFAACLGHAFPVVLLEVLVDATKDQTSESSKIHDILQVAAFLGHRFQRITTNLVFGAVEHQNLETINEEESNDLTPTSSGFDRSVPNLPSIQAAVCLACATKQGLLEQDKQEDRFMFTHDIYQQCLRDSLGEGLADKHLEIGQILRQHELFNPGNPSFFFFVVNHLNEGSRRIQSEESLVSLMSLNVEAATIAAEQSAYYTAQRYLSKALEIQPYEDLWEEEYELMLECYTLAADTELACGNFHNANRYVDQVIAHADDFHARQQAAFTKVAALTGMERSEEAQRVIIQALQDLDRPFPVKPKKAAVASDLKSLQSILLKMSNEELLALQPMGVAAHIAESKLLYQICQCANGHKETLALAALKIVRLTIMHGFASVTPYALALYGVIQSHTQSHREAERFGMLSLQMLERVSDHEVASRTLLLLWTFTMHWKSKLSNIKEGITKAKDLATTMGDLPLSLTCALNATLLAFLQGQERLDLVLESYSQQIVVNELSPAGACFKALAQGIANLSSQFVCGVPWKLSGVIMAEGIMLQQAAERCDDLAKFAVLNVKLQLAAFFNQWESAEELVELIGENDDTLRAHFCIHYYLSTSALVQCVRFNETKKRKYRRTMKKSVSDFKKLAEDGVSICEPFFALLLAEEGVSTSKKQTMLDAFDYAIRCFGKEGSINYQGLAYERAARNLLRHHKDGGTACIYLRNARVCYEKWGAVRKANLLKEEMDQKLR